MTGRRSRQPGIVLENREVVALVVGSLVVLGVVFYLGVSVGKGLAPEPPPTAERSLDALDRQAEESLALELTFAERLMEEAEPLPSAKAPAKPEPEEVLQEPERQAKAEVAPTEPAQQARAAALPIPEEEAPSEPEPAAEATRPEREAEVPRFAVQLASFPSREEADSYAKTLREAGLSPRIVSAEIPDKGTYYRVRIGNFPSREKADRFLDDLRREGRFDGIVMPVDG